jgi:PhzF family phenazine biosynthesis protein
MKLKIYHVDAFTENIFHGNPAAVCPLKSWLNDDLLQSIAMENNLSETAFYIEKDNYFWIRWFTPTTEVDLCGHATLATAYVLFNFEKFKGNVITFRTMRSGELTVASQGQLLTLNFPADTLVPVQMSQDIKNSFDIRPQKVFKGKTDYFFVYDKESDIKTLKPSLDIISKLDCRGVIVTAPGEKSDFVSRFFGPQSGVDEDPVTGSAHTTLTPYWVNQVGKDELTAIQLSSRRGILKCRLLKNRVEISGYCRLYLTGEINTD